MDTTVDLEKLQSHLGLDLVSLARKQRHAATASGPDVRDA